MTNATKFIHHDLGNLRVETLVILKVHFMSANKSTIVIRIFQQIDQLIIKINKSLLPTDCHDLGLGVGIQELSWVMDEYIRTVGNKI